MDKLPLFGYVRVSNIGETGSHRLSALPEHSKLQASLQFVMYSLVNFAEFYNLEKDSLVTVSLSNIIDQ
jgi:hypothetical protein